MIADKDFPLPGSPRGYSYPCIGIIVINSKNRRVKEYPLNETKRLTRRIKMDDIQRHLAGLIIVGLAALGGWAGLFFEIADALLVPVLL